MLALKSSSRKNSIDAWFCSDDLRRGLFLGRNIFFVRSVRSKSSHKQLAAASFLFASRPAAARQISRTATMPNLGNDPSRKDDGPTDAAIYERRGAYRCRNRVENDGRLAPDVARPADIGVQSDARGQADDCWGGLERSRAEAMFLPRVERALAYVAHLIETRPEGESYWPIFERLEREREQLASRADRLRAAKARM
ncbi:hypothetical protein [Mesorhizobium caraganae]|uniref:hypothetical protein n=1 Tax=Mesorhizobium caraganae TaxID=483206 RepID=UPI0033381B84